MPIHDTYCRNTPFELVLPGGEFAEARFPLIQEEARERGVDLGDPEAFPLLGEVGAILREIRPRDDDPQLLTQYGNILFHTFHFWKEGRVLYFADTGVVRFLVDAGPREGDWEASLPAQAGYIQLPQHLIWTPGGEGRAPESLDGIFWSAPEGGGLSLLVVMGMRPDRPGLSVVPLPPLPLEAAAPWASLQVRPRGRDFQSALPGAELEGLYAVESGAEAVKLAMRLFWYLDTVPGSVASGGPTSDPLAGSAPPSADCPPPNAPEATRVRGPLPSALPYRRIVLGET